MKQFDLIKVKLSQVISKLNNILINTLNAYLFYNMYLIEKMCFQFGIVSITFQEEEVVIKVYKLVLLKKLNLSEKFSKRILCTKKQY